MKITSKIKSPALLGLIGLMLATAPGHATLSKSDGDIFAAFRSTGSDTIKSYIIDLGSYTQFTNAASFGGFSFGSSGTTGADLAYAFGTNWYTRSDIEWGIYGVKATAPVLVFAGAAETTPGTQTTPYNTIASSPLSSTKSSIATVNNAFTNNPTAGTTTASTNGIDAGFQTGTGGGTYYNAVTGFLGNVFFSGSGISSGVYEGAVNASTNGAALQDLYAINSSTTTYYGTLSLSTNGVISAVPEPSTYALIGLGALLLLIAYRRHSTRP